MTKKLSALAALVAAFATISPAHALTLTYSTNFDTIGSEWSTTGGNTGDTGILGQLYGDGTSATVAGVSPGAGTGTLSFDLLGFRTLDGAANGYTDTFTVSINGVDIFTGTFNLGGGGSDSYSGPVGTTVTGGTGSTDIGRDGGTRTITIPFAILLGSNTITFSYSNLQSYDDEAWGLDNVSVTGEVSPVPLPASLPLLGAALVGVGGLSRLRKKTV
ncbi:VPLPA-CTERM sorting domain-containing protein [Aestuariivirga sp.]|uniref:VPLPA-CTERM sorting domain-containing protein n=1 Tax=Aestuariivirga sp. TaxID=2650926 RepID=UPI0039E42554